MQDDSTEQQRIVPVCFYAAKSLDAICGAAALYRHYKTEIDFIAWDYGVSLKEITPAKMRTKTLYFIGNIPNVAELTWLISTGYNVSVFAHKDTEIEIINDVAKKLTEKEKEHFQVQWHLIGNKRASAGYQAWISLSSNIPNIIVYVQDYTLGTNLLATSGEIVEGMKANISSVETAFNVITMPNNLNSMQRDGKTILHYKVKLAEEILSSGVDHIDVKHSTGFVKIPIINVGTQLAKVVTEIMNHNAPMVIGYCIEANHVVFNFRSKADGIDVGKLAAMIGGGGSRNIAGLRVTSQGLIHGSPKKYIEHWLNSARINFEELCPVLDTHQ